MSESVAGASSIEDIEEDEGQDLRDLVEDLADRVEGLKRGKEWLTEELEEERKARRELEAEFEEREEDLAILKERTDLLKLLDDPDNLDGRQRSVALIQHLHRSALSRAPWLPWYAASRRTSAC